MGRWVGVGYRVVSYVGIFWQVTKSRNSSIGGICTYHTPGIVMSHGQTPLP